MEFVKVGKNYMIKNSNGRIVSEKEKIELENKELIIKDFESNECQGKTTRKLTKNKKRLKNLEALQNVSPLVKDIDINITALDNEVQNDTIEEANKSI